MIGMYEAKYVTYCNIGKKKTVIIGSTFDKKEDAMKYCQNRGKEWIWVQVGHNDFNFAGWIT